MKTRFMKIDSAKCSNSQGADTRVVLNIGGHIYETKIETLNRFPDSLLGNRKKRMQFYNSACDQYFLNRSRIFFDAILFFYQSGILTCPQFVPHELFIDECRFFELPNEVITGIKSTSLESPREQHRYDEQMIPTFKSRLWDILQNPKSSPTAQVYSTVSLFFVALSVASSSLESMNELTTGPVGMMSNPWTFLELMLNTFFLLELLLSGICSRSRKDFFNSLMTWVDILAVVPYFCLLALKNEHIDTFQCLRILRLFRVARIFRFSKHSKRIALVGKVLVSCSGDLKALLLCVLVVVTLAGSLMYYLEQMTETDEVVITNTPIGMYWAIQTLFTVGYGDLVPHTYGGKIFASIFMMFAAATIIIPLLSIIAKFQAEWDVDHHWINKLDTSDK